MTLAPKSDSTVAAAGAAMKLAQSRTLRPSKMPSSIVGSLPGFIDAFGIGFLVHLTDVGAAMQREKCSAPRAKRSSLRSRGDDDLLAIRQQRGIAACCRGVDGHRLF